MEPNKMEEDFRQKLNAREIQPSGAAWDRLDAMLSVAEKTTPKRNYRWLYIAASVAIFFAVGLFLFQQEKPIQDIQINTDSNAVVTSEKNTERAEDLNESTAIMPEVNQKEESIAETASVKKGPIRKSAVNNAINLKNLVNEEVAQNVPQKISDTPKVGITQNVAIVKDQPLADVSQSKPQVRVNASSLLSSVEGELNQEFRETTLQKLNRNFKAVKTAVANRNYE